MARNRNTKLLAKLAISDLLYDKKVSFCIIASLIAVIAPLLLLFSLKYGIVSQLRHQLMDNPANLEIKTIGNSNLSKAWFKWLEEQPETLFVMPLTRSLNTSVDLKSVASATDVDLIPTKENDPILIHSQIQPKKGLVLSALAAEKLKVKVNDEIKLIATRSVNNQTEKAMLSLNVDAILPIESLSNKVAFAALEVLIGIENYRDGVKTSLFPEAEGKEANGERENFARARIYAKNLDDVEPLALKLREQYHIETDTKAREIANVKAIDSVLNVIFLVIAITSIIGCILSLIGAFLANIDRKRKEIAVLRLLGFQQNAVSLYLIFQAVVLSSLAFIISYLFFLVGSQIFNVILGNNLSSNFVSSLHPLHLLFAFVIAFILAGIVAGIGAIRAVKIQPAESLRDV